jgi:predicted kinase
MKNKGNLILVRGIPGSGKSTFSKLLGGEHIETDMFFMKNGKYKFEPDKLKEAHLWCQQRCMLHMATKTEKIVISNTFTQQWEMDSYFELAKKYEYNVYTVVVEK